MAFILRFFLRPKCMICGADASFSWHWCTACLRALFKLKSLDASCLIQYQGRAASSLLSEIRSAHYAHALHFFGKILATHSLPKNFDYVVTAPQNRQNSALAVIAQRLAILGSGRFLHDFFEKPSKHKQHGRGAEDRLDTKLFMRCKPSIPLAGARILLLDDVSTTGTTLAQCTHLLREQGVGSITRFTLARSPAKFKGESQEANKKTE